MMTDRVSISDVAADAGVSITTVSHALSGKRAVSRDTREKIELSVSRLGYRPNVVAQGFRSQRTHTVALLVADITNPYYPAVARAMQDVLIDGGYVPIICNTDGDADTERMFLREMLARNVDGLIVEHLSLALEEIRAIVGAQLPLVIMGPKQPMVSVDQVVTDDALGIDECVRYLAKKGIVDVGFISGLPGRGPGAIRLAAFRAAMHDVASPVRENWIGRAPYTRDGGAQAAHEILKSAERPQAVMCANDLIAIGAFDAARSLNLNIPKDVAIVGFDNIDTANLVSPRLTTIDNPAHSVGAACAEALLRRLVSGPDYPYQRVSLPTRLIERESA